jgi:hypothetical protein
MGSIESTVQWFNDSMIDHFYENININPLDFQFFVTMNQWMI